MYMLLRQWMRQKHDLIILLATLLFAAHPLHTEVVANIKSRDEILGLLFAILSLKHFHKYSDTPQVKHLSLSSICFLLAIFIQRKRHHTLCRCTVVRLFFQYHGLQKV